MSDTNTSSSNNYIFRAHSDGASAVNLKGWANSAKLNSEKIKTIKDTLKKGASKVATSVPSPFARMHLFDTAFKMVAENPDGDTVYHQLVSDCLDMFQLLFTAGNNDEHLTYRTWIKTERLAVLRNSGRAEHKLLADSLDMFFTGRFANTQTITLIYYKKILMGGTSPLTVFFTSPNWQREMNQNNLTLSSSTQGDIYFDMDYCPLHKRDKLFISFMYRYYLAYRSTLHTQCEGLASYIRNTIERQVPDIAQRGTNEWAAYVNDPASMDRDYLKLATTANTSIYLQIGSMFCYTAKQEDIPEMIQNESDFVMLPTVNHYLNQKDATTNVKNTYRPLVLSRNMTVLGTYTYGNTPWQPDTDIRISSIMDLFGNPVPLSDRRLPGDSNVKYPFITTEDFLESTLIRMPFKLNNQKFFTGSQGEFSYLLPIKKEYFTFFTKEDLKRYLTIISGQGKVTVQLQVPIRNTKGNAFVIFTKEYEISQAVFAGVGAMPGVTPVAAPMMGLAITPFYRITDTEPQLQSLNDYTVLLAEDTKDGGADLSFWQCADIATQKKLVVSKPEARTFRSRSGSSYYYKVGSAFDLIELKLKDDRNVQFTGLIIPEFREANNRHANKDYTFAVDFGTSNSHISYLEREQDKQPKPFEITAADQQTVALNAAGEGATDAEKFGNGFGQFKELKTFINREFLPLVLGESSGSEITFPVRTATAEKSTFPSETPSLFHNINAGFYLDNDEAPPEGLRYTTNLKWLFENSRNQSDPHRIEAFLKELLMLIRNKVIMNGGNISNTKVVWLAPLSMKQRSVDLFKEKWAKAFQEVFKNCGARLLEPITESVAPYFFLKNNTDANIRDFADAINIDIGGGTTDVMFFMRKTQRYLSTSFKFAGNDIWGDGYNRVEKDNGFIRHFKSTNKESQRTKERRDNILEKFLTDPNLTSEDVTSLLFRYDYYFGFSQSINLYAPKLKLILFLHYSAIIFHIVQIMEQEQMDVPRYFTFTGKGSQYLNLMCGQANLTKFTKLLFAAYTQKAVPADFRVVLTNNPKQATANGATLFANTPVSEQIDKDKIDIVTHWGNDNQGQINFQKNITTAGEVKNNQIFADSVLRNLQHFVESTLDNQPIASFMADYEITNLGEYKRFLTGENATQSGEMFDSFYTLMQGLSNKETDTISDTYFFWPLKDALYQLSKTIIQHS